MSVFDVAASDALAGNQSEEQHVHQLRVATVQKEANDTVSLVFDIPETIKPEFAYHAGQYLTLRVEIDGKPLLRCYSMSSAPETDELMRVTVKKVAGGRVSTWLNEQLMPGQVIDVMVPEGRFCLRNHDNPIVLLAGGSGITPLLSLAKSALASTRRKVTLVYANRDKDAIILGSELEALAAAYPDRFTLILWLDSERGFITQPQLAGLGVLDPGADYYICGPEDFMKLAESAAFGTGANRDHVFVERFDTPPDDDTADATSDFARTTEVCEKITISWRKEIQESDYHQGDAILEAARRMGLRPPFACLIGSCAACMAKVTEGTAVMRVNNALTTAEVEEGYILTCQAYPTSKEIKILFEE